ncbi:hypothetical protein EDD21DRAFT_138755 [Dissophora ornata]|nr:hypothetical protein EDD21DRAFT_138755 [Dissophora ornata]
MGSKKKKGVKRASKTEFEAVDAQLYEILTESSRATATAPQAPAKNSVALPPSSSVPQLVQDAAKKEEGTADEPCDPSTATGNETITGMEATTGNETITGIEAIAGEATTALGAAIGNESTTVAAEVTVAEGRSLPRPKPEGEVKCHHVKGAVNLPKFVKGLTQQKDWDHCKGCINAEVKAKKHAKRLDSSIANLLPTETESVTKVLPADPLWMCLSCFELNCGEAIKGHALTHHAKKDRHPLVINMKTLDFWCYECNREVDPSSKKNPVILEFLAKIKTFLQIKQSKIGSWSKTKEPRAISVTATATSTATSTTPKAKVFTPGLRNLGNTCFFNSVVQILTETKSLRSILSEDEKKRSAFPESLAASTDVGIGPLTTNFKEFLHVMRKQKGGVVTPEDLFRQIAKKWKIFRGFRQQDSHELMRYLFDGIKQEEMDLIKRQLSEEAEQKKIAEEQEPSTDEIVDDRQVESREVVEKALKYVPFIDSCFSGKLVSVIVCDTCKKRNSAICPCQ